MAEAFLKIEDVREKVFGLGDRSAKVWGWATILTGFASFFVDLLLALSLQRFFFAVGLINSSHDLFKVFPLQSRLVESSVLLGLGTLKGVMIWLNSTSTGIAQVAFETGFRKNIVEWALWSGKTSSGEVSTLFNDIAIGSAAAISTGYYLLSRFVMVFASALVLFYYSPQLSLIVVGIVLVLVPYQQSLDKKLNRVSIKIQKALAEVTNHLMRGVKNSLFLQIHGFLSREINNQHGLISEYEDSSRRYYSLGAMRAAVPQVIGIWVVVMIANKGMAVFQTNPATLVTFLYLVVRFFQTLSESARVIGNVRGNWPRLSILSRWYESEFKPNENEILSAGRPSKTTFLGRGAVGFKLDSVTFGWESHRNLVNKFSIDIQPGSSTVILGPSGIGKTSLLLLLTGLLEPSSGRVEAFSNEQTFDVSKEREKLQGAIAYVGPDPFVIAGTIRDFLCFGIDGQPDPKDLQEVLKLANCDFIDSLANGLNHPIAEQGMGLSAGQKQRLSIARALLRKPKLLLLDEATANLDADSERAILDTVKKLKGAVTVIAVTHKETLVDLADKVVRFFGPGQVTVSNA